MQLINGQYKLDERRLVGEIAAMLRHGECRGDWATQKRRAPFCRFERNYLDTRSSP